MPIRPGAYVRATDLAELDSVAPHRVPLRRVHSTLDRASGGKITTRRHVHVARLPATDVVVVDGVRATSPPRTVVDLARTVPFESAVVSGDHALATGLVTPELLDDALARCRGRRGAAQAARAVAFMDDGLGKYTEHLRPGQSTEQALIEEKFREDRIRATGTGMAGWGWRELSEPAEVARRLRQAFG